MTPESSRKIESEVRKGSAGFRESAGRIKRMNHAMWKKAAAGFLLLLGLAAGAGADRYDLLRVSGSVEPKRMRRGQEGVLRLRFRVEPGIRILSQPDFKIEITSSDALSFPKAFYSASDLEMTIVEEEGREYLDMSAGVGIPCTVKLEARSGNHVVRGRVKYFGCDREDGWTMKNKTRFSASFYSSSRVYRR